MNLCGVLALLLLQSVSAAPVFLQGGSPLPGNVPFSAAVRQGDVLYLSGQLGTLPGTRTLAPGGIQAEARQAVFNIESVLAANGLGLKDVIRCTVNGRHSTMSGCRCSQSLIRHEAPSQPVGWR
jgi:enamine deaminase RidA (YjgF/YER057c/UK114 family)